MAIMRYGGAWTARGLIMMCLMPRAISCQTATCVGTRAIIPTWPDQVANLAGHQHMSTGKALCWSSSGSGNEGSNGGYGEVV